MKRSLKKISFAVCLFACFTYCTPQTVQVKVGWDYPEITQSVRFSLYQMVSREDTSFIIGDRLVDCPIADTTAFCTAFIYPDDTLFFRAKAYKIVDCIIRETDPIDPDSTIIETQMTKTVFSNWSNCATCRHALVKPNIYIIWSK